MVTSSSLAYELVGEKEKAIASYTKAGLWRECLNVAYTIPMSSQDIAQLAIRLADSCVERRQFSEAARLYVDYGKDEAAIKNAVKALAKAYQFTECIRIVSSCHACNNIRSMMYVEQKWYQISFIQRLSPASLKQRSLCQN